MSFESHLEWDLYGDNILECWRLVEYALKGEYEIDIKGELNVIEPTINLIKNNSQIKLNLFPSTKNLNLKIKEKLYSENSTLRESPDVILFNTKEKFIYTFEFCSALPAGNNAWQRQGRALSLSLNGIKHFHIAKLGGYELDKNREKKSPRLPNPLILISYLKMSSLFYLGKSFFVPIISDDTPELIKSKMGQFDCKNLLSSLICGILTNTNTDKYEKDLIHSSIGLINSISKKETNEKEFNQAEWVELANKAYKANENLLDFLLDKRKISWKKSAPTNKSSTGKVLQTYLENNSYALGSKNLPICLLANYQIKSFEDFLQNLYEIESNRVDLSKAYGGTLLITCDSGFKPRGDDSRPARGLTPFARSLMPNKDSSKLLVFLYGPCPLYQWEEIKSGNFKALAEKNGLWESIYKMADYLILDSEKHPHPLFISINK